MSTYVTVTMPRKRKGGNLAQTASHVKHMRRNRSTETPEQTQSRLAANAQRNIADRAADSPGHALSQM